MTVIAAVARHGRVTMSADTASSYHGNIVLGARKILRLPLQPWSKPDGEEVLLAGSGHAGHFPVVARAWNPPPLPDTVDDGTAHAWAQELAIRCTEAAAGVSPNVLQDEDRGMVGGAGSLLLGWRGRLFYLTTHYAMPVLDGIAALGSGCDVALGVMYASEQRDHPYAVTRQAVDLACNLVEGCRVGAGGPDTEVLDHRTEQAAIRYEQP